jgi:trehalose 6-phosphate synthase/phosphatase
MLRSPRHDRLIVVSNRLPLTLSRQESGRWEAKPSSGGLVSAMVPVLRRRGGVWIGWPGNTDTYLHEVEPALQDVSESFGCSFKPVMLSDEEMQGFYYGFSNEIIWPLFHDLFTNCNFRPEYWQVYQDVNQKFAEAVADEAQPGDFVWVHDYHLMELAGQLRKLDLEVSTGFFLHTPFPPLEIFLKLPWRFEILRSLLEFDSLGFQTLRDRRNFLQCARALFNCQTEGAGAVVQLHVQAEAEGADALPARQISVGSFPIGIDFHAVADVAETPEVREKAAALKDDLKHRQMILGVDRLDYTKGLLSKMEAFRHALRRYPELRGNINLVQHVVPSRAEIPEYRQLRLELEGLIGEINGEFTQSGWVPIHYMFHSLKFEELVAYYQAADIAFVTSLKDGMNLVAKEYCAAKCEEDGVLILSEFAGAAAQLQKGALLINPHDVVRAADRLYQAYHMPAQQRRERMRSLRRTVRTQDVYRWAETFLSVTGSREITHLPYTEDYVPRAT